MYGNLPVFPHVEQHQHTGAGVGADDGANIAGDNIFNLGIHLANLLFQLRGVLGAVTVTDEHGFVVVIAAGFAEFFGNVGNGSLPAPNLVNVDEVTLGDASRRRAVGLQPRIPPPQGARA